MNEWVLTFGYRHVEGIPPCEFCFASGDPSTYMSMETHINDPLRFRMRCWCGSTLRGTFENLKEREEFLAKQPATV